MSWDRFKQHYLFIETLDFALDISRMDFADDYLEVMKPKIDQAIIAMEELEGGAIANPDENRMVGHYWLRDASLAPTPELKKEISDCESAIKAFAAKIHSGEIKGSDGKFEHLLCIGIGGSALGPEFVNQALGNPTNDPMTIHFFDNTDPNGMDKVLAQLKGKLGKTLAVVTSKSGGTPETRNGMVEAENAWTKAGLKFGPHAVAVTGLGSKLDKHAVAEGWLTRFPMWDWVGGRTSELAAVGLVPAALSGFDIDAMLKGAKEMDAVTRVKDFRQNPAALMALMWFYATDGVGKKDMVILPYKDRLELFSRYLQQLVMESLGKELDLDGNTVHQGIAVYGNKGSTDQHAYVQQLRDGVLNFFATFIEVHTDRAGESPFVEEKFTSGDFLQGLLLGTRDALYEKGRESITISVRDVSAHTIGMLIALYERAVGFYGSLVNVNAYHQPGVEAGKKAAASTLELRQQILDALSAKPGEAFTAEQLASELGLVSKTELIFKLLEHMAANQNRPLRKLIGDPFYESKYLMEQ
ncbi:glucose-6-phosphate isomerase [Cerasicoccus arenae]|uniref:Glucose-6-phosphate isomerase n=1 Tax=Cerasicoccus arenae TaxID=424488 RepID=A0A8J3DGB1_9BACT|nr:glucose-6-phosphate isomerase [Cerasicoccus arenae]MBK1857529.1 glucose-6-phosphate isomerase [Cerasicoccus arenae]GHB95538.1 glucose-6-phosphate isomerase [Cerasicoccus arenae]